MNSVLTTIAQNMVEYADHTAFVINETQYTYRQFAQRVTATRRLIRANGTSGNDAVGVVTGDNIETYAAIYACWFERKAFLPLNPKFPEVRNLDIIKQAEAQLILNTTNDTFSFINNDIRGLDSLETDLSLSEMKDEDVMYILFTSGSTGVPKGVPINRRNLDAFVNDFFANGYAMSHSDRFLQMFDFTFDVSVQCYVLPLFIGASVHTVPQDNIKFLSAYKILEKQRITVAKMVPSTIAFLRPYFDRIKLPEIRYSLFSGEALPTTLVEEWAACVPNALIENYYGPTEATIDCLWHRWDKASSAAKTYNGIMSIGRTFGTTQAIIIGEQGTLVAKGKKGELCISGDQVTTGYLNNPAKNKDAFFESNGQRFYRTGDLVFEDSDGDVMYCGRIDNQVQVQGFRVELGEIEFHAKHASNCTNLAAVAHTSSHGSTEIYLFIEAEKLDIESIVSYLAEKLPWYMQPLKIYPIPSMPLNNNGKTDRKKLLEYID